MGRNLRIAVAFLGLSVVFVPSAFGQPWIEHDPINPEAPEEGDPPGGARDIERAHDVGHALGLGLEGFQAASRTRSFPAQPEVGL